MLRQLLCLLNVIILVSRVAFDGTTPADFRDAAGGGVDAAGVCSAEAGVPAAFRFFEVPVAAPDPWPGVDSLAPEPLLPLLLIAEDEAGSWARFESELLLPAEAAASGAPFFFVVVVAAEEYSKSIS